jgi:RNA-directed DNA polymerase
MAKIVDSGCASPETTSSTEEKRNNMLEEILAKENITAAFRKVISNGGAAGIDGMAAQELTGHMFVYWDEIKGSILSGSYQPSAVKRVYIPKPNGEKRGLGIPTVTDRMLQQAISQQLSKIYEPLFSGSSYGFRAGRSAHQAVKQAGQYANEGNLYVVELDLEKFFDRVNHDKLMCLLSTQVGDKRVLKLIRKYLEAGVMENGVVSSSKEGTPQGGNLSPLLANVMLDPLDKELEKRGHKFVRYADDISIYVKSQRGGERVLESITKWIEGKLKLKVNRDKSGVRQIGQSSLLGFGFKNKDGEIKIAINPKSIKRFKEKVRKLTGRSQPGDARAKIAGLLPLTRGWVNYFAISDCTQNLKDLDGWVRRRLRMCIWKQWKLVRTRFKSLLKLGATYENARAWSNSRKGYWRVAGSGILTTTITNKRLKQAGYQPLEELYRKRIKA